jgi:AraC family transcriptional regulator
MCVNKCFPAPGSFAGCKIGQRRFSDLAVTETVYDPGQRLPRHSHASGYISVVLRGSYTEQCGSTSIDLLPGHVVLHVSDETHSNIFHQQGGQLLNLELSNASWERLAEHDGIRTNARKIVRSSYALQLGKKLQKELSRSSPGSAWAVEGLTMELIAETIRNRGKPPKVDRCRWLYTVEEILRERYTEPLTLKELSAQVSVHPVHLARVFRSRHHCSVGEYIRRLRIEAACRELLNPRMSIADVAYHAGFSDHSHLCRILKEHTGMSPGQFRKNQSHGKGDSEASEAPEASLGAIG